VAQQVDVRDAAAVAGPNLLDHPFYQRWQRGELQREELAGYAEQYRHFEASLPGMLRSLIARAADPAVAEQLQRNLDDEESTPRAHVDLFDEFAAAAGAADGSPQTAATRRLLDTYGELIASSVAGGVAAIAAYESQAPAVAASKAAGLRRHYGFDDSAVAFWDVHAEMDKHHAAWGGETLALLGAPAQETSAAARRALEAWWAFLDEREASRPA